MRKIDRCFEYTIDEKYEPLHLQLVVCSTVKVRVHHHISSFGDQSDIFPNISSACRHELGNHCSRIQGNFSIFQSEIFLVVLEVLCCQIGGTFLKKNIRNLVNTHTYIIYDY